MTLTPSSWNHRSLDVLEHVSCDWYPVSCSDILPHTHCIGVHFHRWQYQRYWFMWCGLIGGGGAFSVVVCLVMHTQVEGYLRVIVYADLCNLQPVCWIPVPTVYVPVMTYRHYQYVPLLFTLFTQPRRVNISWMPRVNGCTVPLALTTFIMCKAVLIGTVLLQLKCMEQYVTWSCDYRLPRCVKKAHPYKTIN